jgi:hypothetical protein
VRLGAIAVVFLFLSPVLAVAQQAADSPDEVARKFFQAQSDERWMDAARLLDLGEFAAVRDQFVRSFRNVPRIAPITVERLLRMEPDMPRAVAEYRVKQDSERVQEFDMLGQEFARISSVDSLAALPVQEAAARWLEAKGPRWQFARQRKAESLHPGRFGNCRTPAEPLPGQTEGDTVEIMGVAHAPGDSVSYAIFNPFLLFERRAASRPTKPGIRKRQMSPRVVTLRKVSGNWRIEPTRDLPGPNGLSGSYSVCVVDTSIKAASAPK